MNEVEIARVGAAARYFSQIISESERERERKKKSLPVSNAQRESRQQQVG